MPPSDHRVRGAQTHSGLSASDSSQQEVGGVGVEPAYHPPRPTTPFVKGPVGQNKHFTQHIWKGSAPKGHLIHHAASITL